MFNCSMVQPSHLKRPNSIKSYWTRWADKCHLTDLRRVVHNLIEKVAGETQPEAQTKSKTLTITIKWYPSTQWWIVHFQANCPSKIKITKKLAKIWHHLRLANSFQEYSMETFALQGMKLTKSSESARSGRRCMAVNSLARGRRKLDESLMVAE